MIKEIQDAAGLQWWLRCVLPFEAQILQAIEMIIRSRVRFLTPADILFMWTKTKCDGAFVRGAKDLVSALRRISQKGHIYDSVPWVKFWYCVILFLRLQPTICDSWIKRFVAFKILDDELYITLEDSCGANWFVCTRTWQAVAGQTLRQAVATWCCAYDAVGCWRCSFVGSGSFSSAWS